MTHPSPMLSAATRAIDAQDEAGRLRPFLVWRSVAILVVLYAVAMLDRQLLILMADPIKRSLHVGDFEIGLLHGFAFVLFYATCAIPLGWAADRYPRRIVIFLGVIIWSIGCAACGLASTAGQLFVARMGVGFGEAALLPAAFSLIADSFPRRRLTTAMAVFACGGILGAGLTTAVGGIVADFANSGAIVTLPLIGALLAWQFAFCIIAAPGLILAFLVFWIVEPPRRTARSSDGTGSNRDVLRHIGAHRGFYLRHFFGFGLVMMLSYAILGWIPVAMARDFGWPMREVGPWLGGILLVTGLVALLGSGRFVDRRINRGETDAHMRYYAYACLILTAAGASIGLAATAGQVIQGRAVRSADAAERTGQPGERDGL